MAPSRLALVLVLACGGCDIAFGLDTDEQPCDATSFDGAKSTDLTSATAFSVNWDQSFAVVIGDDSMNYQLKLPGGMPELIDLGVYNNNNVALTPEGNALFYTASEEPPLLEGALRKADSTWLLAAQVPRGTFAGTPSADVFGPRRLLVQLRENDGKVQEYEDDNGHWVTVGDPHDLPSVSPPNLTPNGLTAVYTLGIVADDGTTTYDVYQMSRPTTAEWFGAPVKILTGNDEHPQLLGRCKQLYTVHATTMRRYDR